jgi:hypothetical protein
MRGHGGGLLALIVLGGPLALDAWPRGGPLALIVLGGPPALDAWPRGGPLALGLLALAKRWSSLSETNSSVFAMVHGRRACWPSRPDAGPGLQSSHRGPELVKQRGLFSLDAPALGRGLALAALGAGPGEYFT